MRLLTLVLAFLLTAASAGAQTANFAFKRTLNDAANYTYCTLNGQLTNPYGGAIQGAGLLTAAGTTTVTASVTTAFGNVPTPSDTVGAVILVSTDGGSTFNAYRVASKTDGDTIVIDTAVTWASPGFPWGWYYERCGLTDSDGWIAVGSTGGELTAEYNTGSGALNLIWQCRAGALGANPVQVFPDNSAGATSRSYAAPGADSRATIVVEAKYSSCRVGMKGSGPVVTAYSTKR